MIAKGIFGPEERLELLDGEVLAMSPQSSRHATAVQLISEALRIAFQDSGAHVRVQLPLALDEQSEPEPDVAVVSGTARDYVDHHPTRALLLVEVADTSLAYDRGPKHAAYASNEIPEYWLVDLEAMAIEIYRRPEGDRYLVATRLGRGEQITVGETSLPVAELLP